MKKLLLAILVVGFAISSCSIERRLHQKGFHVEWNKNLSSLKKDKKEKQDYVSSEALEEIAIVSPKTTKSPSVNSNSAISVDGVSINESIEAPVFVEDNTTNEVNSQESSVLNNTKIEKVKMSIIASKASSSKKMTSENKTMASSKLVKKALKDDVPIGLLYVLCFFIPFVAVGLATNWDINKVLINLLWTFLCGIPGIIHAIIIVGRNS
jgi:uncharacterized membrane protein YqaE (UPF0057 family)